MKGKIGLEEHFAIEDTLNDSKGFLPDDVWPELRGRLIDIHDRRIAEMDRHGVEMMVLSLNAPAIQAMQDYFRIAATNIRAVEKTRLACEPIQLNALLDFARRAYRRPLTPAEKTSMPRIHPAYSPAAPNRTKTPISAGSESPHTRR